VKERDHLGDTDIDERIILKYILKKRYEDVDWIHQAQDKVQWRVTVNTVTNLWAP
jgi:hypothetical protein